MKTKRDRRVPKGRGSPTLGSEIQRLFPTGTRYTPKPNWSKPPKFPVELFAAAAYLLEASSAYTYIVAPFAPTTGQPRVTYSGPTEAATQHEIDGWREIGGHWAKNFNKPDHDVDELWRELWAERNDVFVVGQGTGPRLKWWKLAHALLIIADEASCNCGYEVFGSISSHPNWANKFASLNLILRTRKEVIPSLRSKNDNRHRSRHVAVDSLSETVARHVVRVLPKGRTTDVGCTMRTLSHNLTIVPPHGQLNAYWHQQLWENEADNDTKLSILLVPFPYSLPEGSFKGDMHNGPADLKWGRFCIDQKWLSAEPTNRDDRKKTWSSPKSRASFVAFIDVLIKNAIAANKSLNGIVLPEYSLDWDSYDELVRHVRDNWPSIEFIVSGVSRDCNDKPGNQVVFTVIHEEGNERIAETHSRRKHHRWRIDKAQVRGYHLEGDLDPNCIWWEYLEIEERVLHLDVFRSRSAFTAVVCEDLARVDPVVSEIRSLGPNLIFALLMDGAQTKARWSGQYATSLADDPGSSVLTLTSFALISRSNAFRASKALPVSRSIALWRNRSDGSAYSSAATDFVELILDRGSLGLVVNLRSAPTIDVTIDGRQDSDTTAWYYDSTVQVSIPNAEIEKKNWRWITGNFDRRA
jgi:hypothetical protein